MEQSVQLNFLSRSDGSALYSLGKKTLNYIIILVLNIFLLFNIIYNIKNELTHMKL